ncbi:uncharacterized protein LOC135131316 isoform X2 [Zophobas morio]|uniref:uncharacterized protein LOC135131316 isoform X2 n=1 Tax=Zophobas morio TaxID=2755281 RepID=UPI0030828C08
MSVPRGPIRSSPTGIPLARPSSDKGAAPWCPFRAWSVSVTNSCPGSPLVAVIASRALYAGTLATIWTTAPSLQRPCAQLAALCLLATLTAAARCYACSNANLARFEDPSFSPIDDSDARTRSSIVLGRPTPPPRDTSVVVADSEGSPPNNETKTSRTRRELTAPTGINRIVDESKRNALGIGKLNLEKRSDVLVSSETDGSVSESSDRVNSSIVDVAPEAEHQNDSSFVDEDDPYGHLEGTERPMPPVHDHGNASLSDLGILVLVFSAIVLTVALGLITCVLSHYRPVAGEGAADGGTAADPHDAARTPTTAPMLSVVSAGAAAGVGGMDRLRGGRAARELAATRDRQVRLHAVHTDIAINLPPNIAMPDGEEHPFTSSRLHIRDPEQESEIHQKCIRPPPNRTVLESESPPPYRSSSAGLLGSSSSSSSSSGGGGGDWSGGGGAPLVVRCHSMSSSTSSSSNKRPEAGSSGQKTDFLHRTVKIFTGGKKGSAGVVTPPPQTLPVVIVPTRPRRTSGDQQGRPKPSV